MAPKPPNSRRAQAEPWRASVTDRLVPHSTLAVFERSGHSPHVEEREMFARALGATFPSSAPP